MGNSRRVPDTKVHLTVCDWKVSGLRRVKSAQYRSLLLMGDTRMTPGLSRVNYGIIGGPHAKF
jgi:hypothetical protein